MVTYYSFSSGLSSQLKRKHILMNHRKKIIMVDFFFKVIIAVLNCPGNKMHRDLSLFFANDCPCRKPKPVEWFSSPEGSGKAGISMATS